jgi:Ribonuclease G/E
MDKTTLAKIGKYILDGLTEEEACTLSDVKFEELNRIKENNEKVRDYITKCKINFKHFHILEMQKKKSEKTSQWLLERLRPEDFNISQRSKNPTTVNVIGTIINQIQNDNDRPLIVRSREDRFESEIKSDQEDLGREIVKILN